MAYLFGNITNPMDNLAPGAAGYQGTSGQGLITLFTNLVKLIIIVAGVYTLFNFILAGITFMGAGGDPKAVQKAQERLTQSILGLIVVAGSFLIAAVVGYVLYGGQNWNLLLSPVIFSP